MSREFKVYLKVEKVIESCETQEQLSSALNYKMLYDHMFNTSYDVLAIALDITIDNKLEELIK